MRASTSCPDAAWWNDMLDERLAAGDQAGLGAHLEECRQCQQTLEQLTAGDRSWGNLAQRLEQAPRPVLLRRIIEQLKAVAEVGAETAGLETLPSGNVTFLCPSCDPAHLGRLGPYEVLEIIGRGGMGVVLKAFDPALRRTVAIKVLAPPWASSAAARLRFLREARATAAVRHDHVVAVHAVDQVDGLPYLVMEYVPGVSLQQHLQHTGPLDVEEIVRIGMQTAAGLAAAHAQGLIHRDVKPANILLEGPDRRVKLSDFGLARACDDVRLTQSGVISGTPLYMAPEQAHGAALDERADLFSLGSVLYALCTGRPPFRAPTTVAVLKRVCDDMPRPIRDLNPTIPVWLVDFIARLHAKRPEDRFASAEEVARLLSQYLRYLRSPHLEKTPTFPRRGSSPTKRMLALGIVILTAAALSVLLCVAAALRLFPPQPDDNRAPQPDNEPSGLQVLAADDAAFKDIEQNLDNGNVLIRVAATKSLAKIKPNERRAEVALKLVKLLEGDEPFSRKGALPALGVWGTAKEVPALIEALRHTDVFTRREALKVIGRFQDKRALPPVMRCFKEFQTRDAAKTALRAMGSMAENEVLGLLNGADVFLRADAIRTLKDIGTQASVPALNAAVASNDIFLTEPARDALTAIAARKKN